MEVGADDRRRHLLPVGTAAVHGRSDPGESGEPSGTQDGHLGYLAALDRVPAQLLGPGNQALGIEDVDRPELGPHGHRVHVGVVAGCGHHRRTLVPEHGGDHEALTLADPRHADGQDVVLGLGEQPGAGGDVDPEGHGFTLGGGTASRRGRRCGVRRPCDPCDARPRPVRPCRCFHPDRRATSGADGPAERPRLRRLREAAR